MRKEIKRLLWRFCHVITKHVECCNGVTSTDNVHTAYDRLPISIFNRKIYIKLFDWIPKLTQLKWIIWIMRKLHWFNLLLNKTTKRYKVVGVRLNVHHLYLYADALVLPLWHTIAIHFLYNIRAYTLTYTHTQVCTNTCAHIH